MCYSRKRTYYNVKRIQEVVNNDKVSLKKAIESLGYEYQATLAFLKRNFHIHKAIKFEWKNSMHI